MRQPGSTRSATAYVAPRDGSLGLFANTRLSRGDVVGDGLARYARPAQASNAELARGALVLVVTRPVAVEEELCVPWRAPREALADALAAGHRARAARHRASDDHVAAGLHERSARRHARTRFGALSLLGVVRAPFDLIAGAASTISSMMTPSAEAAEAEAAEAAEAARQRQSGRTSPVRRAQKQETRASAGRPVVQARCQFVVNAPLTGGRGAPCGRPATIERPPCMHAAYCQEHYEQVLAMNRWTQPGTYAIEAHRQCAVCKGPIDPSGYRLNGKWVATDVATETEKCCMRDAGCATCAYEKGAALKAR